MKAIVGICALAVLLAVAPANADFLWQHGDGMNLDYIADDPDIEGQFNDHDDWNDGDFYVLDGNGSVPHDVENPSVAGWRYAQQDWEGTTAYNIGPDTVLKSEGDASQRITPNDGGYHDIFAGVRILGLTPGNSYDISFDFQADIGFIMQSGPGQGTGDDHVNSASWQVADVAYSPQGWGATEDYPGHETGSTWISNGGDWDGEFHTQYGSFLATNPTMSFVLKFRSMSPEGSFRLDNMIVTPEPASLLLLGLGGLLGLRRRK